MQPKMTISRAVIYAALILFALYFLFPLYVMLSTSFKDIDQLRTGNLLTPPSHWTVDPWIKAWSGACTGVRCDGMQPFFMNSVRMVIPAVLISSIVGAFNGRRSCCRWRASKASSACRIPPPGWWWCT